MVNILKVKIAYFIFWFGYYWYQFFKRTPKYSYLSLRKLFYSTNGNFNRKLSLIIGEKTGVYKIENIGKSFLGTLSDQTVKEIAQSIQQNGYYKFNTLLDNKTVNDLVSYSLSLKAKLMPRGNSNHEFDFFDQSNPITVKYEYKESDLIQNNTIQNLVSDPGLLAIAQSFLGSKPILDMISMWWSTSFSKKASSEVAQLYHFDMERIKFLKIFFYLTDVDEETGPHCYVRGSNNGFPEAVRKDGRISDDEIQLSYPPEDILEITGPKGTILAVDTSGFHKGKNLSRDSRLLLQFEFANSLFGVENTYYRVEKESQQFQQAKKIYPHTYQRYS